MRYPGFVEVWLSDLDGNPVPELYPNGSLPSIPKKEMVPEVVTCYIEAKPGFRFKKHIRDLKDRRNAVDWLSYRNYLDGAEFETCKLEKKKAGDKTITICAELDEHGQFREMMVKKVDVQGEPSKKLIDPAEFLSTFDSGIIAVQTTNEFIAEDDKSEAEQANNSAGNQDGDDDGAPSEMPFLGPPPKIVPDELVHIVKARRLAVGLGDIWKAPKEDDSSDDDAEDDAKVEVMEDNENTWWDKKVMFVFIALPSDELERRNIRAPATKKTKRAAPTDPVPRRVGKKTRFGGDKQEPEPSVHDLVKEAERLTQELRVVHHKLAKKLA
ncbi:hypothetical protein OC845_002112 [Tilletia horrida]|nr:hypothetical protein OC845_002112 [Tilletia horrida]